MTDTDLSALESAARAATPGPWEISRDDFAAYIESRKGTVGEIGDAFDANYISAANPAAILELIAELRQAWAEREYILEQVDDMFDADDLLRAAKEATCKE